MGLQSKKSKKLFNKKIVNKLLQLHTLTILLSISLYSCSKDNLNNVDTFNLSENITLIESTSNVSNLFLNMGVIGIDITKNPKSTFYEFRTEKTFILNNNTINLSDYFVLLEGELLSLNSSPSLKLTLLDNQPYIIKPSYSGFIRDSQNDLNNVDFNILMLFMKEMTTTNDLKVNSLHLLDKYSSNESSTCSYWNTYYVYSTGASRSIAEANLEAQTELEESEGKDVEGCRKIGTHDSSCIWENHFCIATQAYCCD